MDIKPVVLEGRYVRLVPLEREHADALWKAGSDADLWRYTAAKVYSLEQMHGYVETALRELASGQSLPFTTTDAGSGEIIGSTRFAAVAKEHKRVEIGYTFLSPAYQRTPVNTEAKFLMLQHAFEVWGVNRVELKTGTQNSKSRAAIARIGGVEEGILRRHLINQDGFVRDTVFFGLIAEEWPETKARLEAKLSRPWP
ncbi:MAG: GNAT family N-acetyltransferase [Bryobacteraceae bacterium]|nr:GNAT family N-acetyltransferase [Bryobacteraceae bacterium]